MYNYNLGGVSSEGYVKECRPDYEEIYKRMLKEMEIIENFRKSLMEFISMVGTNNFVDRRSGINGIAELLGSVQLDILDREKRMAEIERKLKT